MALPNDIPEKEFMHWVKATLGLQLAKRASCNYIKVLMTGFIDELKAIHQTDEVDHFDTLLHKVLFRSEVKKTKIKGILSWMLYDQSCPGCKLVLDRMCDEFQDSKYCEKFKRHDVEETFKPDLYWWIVSKIYISEKCKVEHATGPEEVDPFAVLSLIRNCKRFDQQVKNKTKWLIELRHELMHSSNNTLTKEKMEEYFAMIKEYIDVIKNSKSNMPTEVLNDIDTALEELDDLEKKELGIFDKENNLHDYTKRAIETLQQCLATDFKIPSDSEFDIITKLITWIERKKCENEKQQLRQALARSEEEKELQAKDFNEKVGNVKLILKGAIEEIKQCQTKYPEQRLEAPMRKYLEESEKPRLEAPMRKYLEESEKMEGVKKELKNTAEKLEVYQERFGIVYPEHKTKPFSDVQFLKEIHMGVDSDLRTCSISSMCQMEDGTILVLDMGNRRLKRLDDKYKVVDFYECKHEFVYVDVVSSSQVVVLIDDGALQFIHINGHEPMVCKKEVRLERGYRHHQCFGMVYCNNQIWICTKHEGICIYNLSGLLKKTIATDSQGEIYSSHLPYPFSSLMVTNNDKTRVYVMNDDTVDILDKYGSILRTVKKRIGFHRFNCITVTDDDLLLSLDYKCRFVEMYDVTGRYLGPLDVGKKMSSHSEYTRVFSVLYDRKNCCLIVGHYPEKCSVLQLNR